MTIHRRMSVTTRTLKLENGLKKGGKKEEEED
jgi:hypothetical protein